MVTREDIMRFVAGKTKISTKSTRKPPKKYGSSPKKKK